MQHGNVRWFDNSRGLGFIQPEDGKDVLVDIQALNRSGIKSLSEGQWVAYDLEYRKGQAVAEDLKIL